MQYGILCAPHADARYWPHAEALALAEFAALGLGEGHFATCGGVRLLTFCTGQPLDARVWQLSFLQALFALQGDLLQPLGAAPAAHISPLLQHGLHYGGKTDPRTAELLVNLALYHSDCPVGETPTVFDPVCGRGTVLFCALNRGMHAMGVEQDKKDVQELQRHLTQVLQVNRVRHSKKNGNIVTSGRTVGSRSEYTIGPDGAQKLILACADTGDCGTLLKKQSAHALVADLPFGQAGRGGESLQQLLDRVLPVWQRVLRTGAGGALAFERGKITRAQLCALVGQYFALPPLGQDAFLHRLENGVQRDILVFQN